MGLFDDALGFFKKQMGMGEEQSSVLHSILGLVGNPEAGGLGGLMDRLREHGLGREADSWVSLGDNLPVTGDQIRDALGGQTVEQLAAQLGRSPAEAAQQLADVLPQMIDKLTPTGSLPDGGLLDKGLSLLKSKLGM
jgi:uncharacterized protein YidB (DUF937 family)